MENTIDQIPKIEYHKKMMGKRVFVILNGGYSGVITAVVDDEHFRIKPDKGEDRIVEIFDIRSQE